MESDAGARAVLLSPLAVDDVFRQQTVPEVQELLRQLQLQLANDAEEVRTLIGIRYLSFLQGLPEITHMQRAAEEALEGTIQFGASICSLDTTVPGAGSNLGKPSEQEPMRYEQQQLLLTHELPLQSSTPLDDFFFPCTTSPSPAASADSHYQRPNRHVAPSPATSRASYHSKDGEFDPQRQTGALRYMQQQLLLLPSRVWEALRRHQFLDALRLILIEGSSQADAAKAAAQQQERHQPLTQPQHERKLGRQLEGCLALARQTTLAAPSLVSSVRALALRHLASADLPLASAADAAAAATLIYLLDSRRAPGGTSEDTESKVVTSAARWLLGVFFSARKEALEAQGALTERSGISAAAVAAGREAVCKDALGGESEREAAVNAAENVLVAFSSSLEAASILFSPLATGAGPLELPAAAHVGGDTAGGDVGSDFAALQAAEAAFGCLVTADSVDISWALRALRKVFGCFGGRPCRSTCSSGGVWDRCCENNELCGRSRLLVFAGQWKRPIETTLCRLPAEGSWRSLEDVRSFWVTLMQRLQDRRPRWPLSSGASLFVVSGQANVNSMRSDGLAGVALEAPGDFYGYEGTAQLLKVLGEACARACESIARSRVRALPLLTLEKGERESSETERTPSEVQKEQPPGAFEQDFQLHLGDIAALFGGSGCPEEMRAALPLRATVVASLLQSLAEWATPLRTSACSAAAEQLKTHSAHLRENEPNIPLIGQARSVEWLFVACSNEGGTKQMCAIVDSNGNVPDSWNWQQKDGEEIVDCQCQLSALLAEWRAKPQGEERALNSVEQQPLLANWNEEGGGDGTQVAKIASTISAAQEAANSLAPYLCLCSLMGYAVGFWPFVSAAVKELQASWRWQRMTAAGSSLDYCSSLDISGGAMSLLLELSRCLAVASQKLKLEDPCTAPLLCFALKTLTVEAVAAAAAAAIAETTTQQQQHLQQDQAASSTIQSHLLQLLVDLELLKAALDAPPPLMKVQKLSVALDELPLALRKAVMAGVEGRGSVEALRKTAREGRQLLQPSLEEILERCIESNFYASSSLLFAPLHSKCPELESLSRATAGGESMGTTTVSMLLGPRESLALLPLTPLPAFAPLLGRSSERQEAPKSPAPINKGEVQEEMQQQPEEPVKQSHRLRLDDAVDSVSRGLQSWLKRGSSDADGPGLFPLKGGVATSSGAAKGAAVVSAASSGLAEAWAKQMEQVSALIGQHVESVQSRASPSMALRLGQRNGSGAASYISASPAFSNSADPRPS